MIRVTAPATIGNIGPGFDTLGLAVRGLHDTIEAERISEGVEIVSIEGEGAGTIPADPEKNSAGIAAIKTLRLLGDPGGIRMKIRKGMPGGSGLGSSAASAAAAAFAANHLYGNRLTRKGLILPATSAEMSVSGSFFADNTAPALLGGAVIVTRTSSPLDAIPLGTISDLKIVLATPDLEVPIKPAREALPKEVPLDDCVKNMSNSCGVAAAFAKNSYRLLTRCLHDAITEPVRAKFIPGFEDVRVAARAAGAGGVAISGAGPTVFAITDSEKKLEEIEGAMIQAFNMHGYDCSTLITEVDSMGATIADEFHYDGTLAKEAEFG